MQEAEEYSARTHILKPQTQVQVWALEVLAETWSCISSFKIEITPHGIVWRGANIMCCGQSSYSQIVVVAGPLSAPGLAFWAGPRPSNQTETLTQWRMQSKLIAGVLLAIRGSSDLWSLSGAKQVFSRTNIWYGWSTNSREGLHRNRWKAWKVLQKKLTGTIQLWNFFCFSWQKILKNQMSGRHM